MLVRLTLFFCLGVSSLFVGTVHAQGAYEKWQPGGYIMSGQCVGIIPSNSTLNNQIMDLRRGFLSAGLYSFIKLRGGNANALFLKYIRVDLGLSNRSGVFELDNGTYSTINSAGLDMLALLPLSFRAAEEIDIYIAAGPYISYRYNRALTPVQPLPQIDNWDGGMAIELGFRLLSGSAIGYRTMVDFRDSFTYRVGSIFFGFSPTGAVARHSRD
jgi:hypothetical protein